MSTKQLAPLHIEWNPTWMRAVDISTGATKDADSIADLGSILNGHRQVLVGVGRNVVFLKTVRLPKASHADLRRILGVQIGQIFPLPATELEFEFAQTADISSEGCLTVVVAIRSTDLRRIHADLQRANLSATRILPVALAAPAAAAKAGSADAVLVDRNPSGLVLDVVQGGIVRLSRLAAENSDPTCEVQRTLAGVKAAGLTTIATPGVGLLDAVKAVQSPLSLLHEAPPIGFVLSEDRDRAARGRVANRTRLGLVAFLASVLLAIVAVEMRQYDVNAYQSTKAAWARKVAKLREIENVAAGAETQMVDVQHVLHQAFAPGQPLSDVMGVIGDCMPRGAWLTGLNLERGKPVEIRGTAKSPNDVATFVRSLGSSNRFRDVTLVFANEAAIAKTPVVQFTISAVCVGNVPMPAPEKAGTRSVASAPATGAGT